MIKFILKIYNNENDFENDLPLVIFDSYHDLKQVFENHLSATEYALNFAQEKYVYCYFKDLFEIKTKHI